MSQAITLAGQRLLARKLSEGQKVVIDQFVFGYFDGLDYNAEVDRLEGMPAAENRKGIIDVTRAGTVNENTVVYSCVMGSNEGTWNFNWVGLYSSADSTIVAINYVPIQTKRATAGLVLGNVFTKNFALEFNAAASLTGINISAESWQIDYTARLRAMDESQRSLTETTTGAGLFAGDAFKVFYDGGSFKLGAGKAIVRGIEVTNSTELIFDPGTLPAPVWLDVYQETQLAGMETKFNLSFANDASDYSDQNGRHFLFKLADITSNANIADGRNYQGADVEYFHKGNLKPATTSRPGYTQLNDDPTKTNTDQAATINAVKKVKDIAETTATTSRLGRTQLNSSTTSTSQTTAATPSAVKAVKDIAETSATTSRYGRVKLSTSTTSTSTSTAATSSAVKAVKDIAETNASTSSKGRVQLSEAVNSTSKTTAATPSAVKKAYDLAAGKANASHSHSAGDLPNSSTSAKGVVQLSTSVTSTSTSVAATSSAVKSANDNANNRVPNSEKGAANGVATLGSDKRIPMSQMNLPAKAIILWFGLVSDVPAGWALCNGSNGTPDLRDRFVMGAGGSLNTGGMGGSKSKTTSSNGAHNHGVTVNNHVLTLNEVPEVSGSFNAAGAGNSVPFGGASGAFSASGGSSGWMEKSGGSWGTRYGTISFNNGGGNAGHKHSVSENNAGGHNHSIDDARPPFYALAYIMKL